MEWSSGVTPEKVCELAIKLRVWQSDVCMPATCRKELMRIIDELWGPPCVTPEKVCDLTLKLFLWQSDVSMPATCRKELMRMIDALWPQTLGWGRR